MSKRNLMIGRQGEKRFSTLCSDAGVTCNKSEEDDNGWDMVVEFPPDPQPKVAIDLRPTAQMALVQIKATEGSGRSVSISLSNALRYARSSLPTFLVLVVLSGDQARYLIRHVWSGEIAAWLKAGREADARGVVAVHQQKVNVAFDDGMEVPASKLLAWMSQCIRNVQPSYAAVKEEIVRTIGFEKTTGIGSVTLGKSGHREMLDQMLGIRKGVSAKRFTFTSERFGIRARHPEIDVSNVLFELVAQGVPATLTAEFRNGERHVVPAKGFQASFDDLHAVRVATQCLEVVLGPLGETRAHARLKREATASAADIALFAELQATPAGENVALEIDFGSGAMDLGAITMAKAHAPERSERWRFLGAAIRIIRSVASDAQMPVPHLSVASIDAAWQDVMVMIALAGPAAMIDFDPAAGAPSEFASFLAYCRCRIGELTIEIVASRPIALDRVNRQRRQIHFGPAQMLYGVLIDGNGEGDRMVESYHRHLKRLSRSGEVLALGDLSRIVTPEFRSQPLKIDRPGLMGTGAAGGTS